MTDTPGTTPADPIIFPVGNRNRDEASVQFRPDAAGEGWLVWQEPDVDAAGELVSLRTHERDVELAQFDLPMLVGALIRIHSWRYPKRLDAMDIALRHALAEASYDPKAGRLESRLVYPADQ